MLIAGAILLAIGLIASGIALWQRKKLERMSATATLSCADAAAGVSGQLCELSGFTRPGAQGPLTSPRGQRECVWYSYEVTHHYQERVEEADGSSRYEERENSVHTDQSESSFYIADDSGQVLIEPGSTSVDKPLQTANDFEDQLDPLFEGGGVISTVGRAIAAFDDSKYRHQEHVLPLNTQIYAIGVLEQREGGPVLTDKKLTISTRSEAELSKSAKLWFWVNAGIAAVSVVAGAALLAAGASA